MNITVCALDRFGHESFNKSTTRESAILVVSDGIIHPTLAVELPHETTFISPLTSADGNNTYRVRTFGYTIAQFVAIAKAYANSNFELAAELINAIEPIIADEDFEG